ncbi:hypothetical protein ABR850_09350 [Aeromonas veronii]|uniref:hypothetical protein n=1 Tax=Aeromonas veronii TaxID=654 RepID=UPI0033064EC9
MEYLTYLTLLGGPIAFIFGAWKYLDTRNREAANKRFEQFRQVSVWFAGRDENGVLTEVQQAIATYQLAEFPEYKSMSLPIIEHMIEQTKDEHPQSLLRKALLDVRHRLQR